MKACNLAERNDMLRAPGELQGNDGNDGSCSSSTSVRCRQKRAASRWYEKNEIPYQGIQVQNFAEKSFEKNGKKYSSIVVSTKRQLTAELA